MCEYLQEQDTSVTTKMAFFLPLLVAKVFITSVMSSLMAMSCTFDGNHSPRLDSNKDVEQIINEG